MKRIEIFIPGKVMLAGEYAVLKGAHALAATLACGMRIFVEWDQTAASWEILSDIWSEPKYVGDDHTPQSDMLCRAIQYMAKRLGMHGGRVKVQSDIEIEYGIGSSSALRLGICSAFLTIKNGMEMSRPSKISTEAIQCAWALQCEGQGIASGYDITAQYIGGLVEFNYEYSSNQWKPRWYKHNIDAINDIVHVFVGGRGAPTTETMQTTSSWVEGGNRNDRLIELSESLVDAFNEALQWPNYRSLGRLAAVCGSSRNFFASGPCFPTTLATILAPIPGLDRVWSWKTTGAGGEDAIIVIGRKQDIEPAVTALEDHGWHSICHKFTNSGIEILRFEDDSTPTLSRTEFDPFTTPKMKGYLR